MGISRRGAAWSRKVASALALGAALAVPAISLAQATPEELAAARHLFNEGKDLEKQKAYEGALAKFKKVAGVKMTPQVRFHIALCEENLGHLVEAINGFALAGEEAKRAGSTAAEVAENAPKRAEALRGRVPTLRLDVAGKLITSKILLDGVPVAASQLGVAAPIDPGEHTVEVQDAAGKATFHQGLKLAEKAAERLAITVHDVEPARAAVTAAPEASPPPPERSRAPVFLAGGVGVASLIASGVFFGLRAGTISTVAASCADPVAYTGCKDTADTRAAMASGRTYSTITSVTLGVGLAGLGAAGILWFVTSPKKAAAPAKAGVRLVPTGPGLDLLGVF